MLSNFLQFVMEQEHDILSGTLLEPLSTIALERQQGAKANSNMHPERLAG